MKKIFWTTVFWLSIGIILRGYIRFFDQKLGSIIALHLTKGDTTCDSTSTGNQLTGDMANISVELQNIQSKLDIIGQTIGTEFSNDDKNFIEDSNLPMTTTPEKIKLFYFNDTQDKKLPANQQINIDSIMSVERSISSSTNLIKDTINLLLEGDLTSQEKKQGFTSEFPNNNFKLEDMNLSKDGVLTLTFSEVPGFTSGGSARMLILQNEIKKTAMQFSQVKEVKFLPDTLFQP